jgi:DNA-binding HxlR family transcriptional regulator
MTKSDKMGRSSKKGRPIMVLLDVLGRRWSMRIMWELRGGDRVSFRELRERCDDVSPTSLNQRLKDLRELQIVDLSDSGFGLTERGIELGLHLSELSVWSEKWDRGI